MNVGRRLRAIVDNLWAARPSTIVTVGVIASTLILASSFVVGFVGSSSPLWGWRFFADLRASGPANVLGGAVLIAAVTALVVAWLMLGVHVWQQPQRTTPLVLKASIAWAVPLLFCLPLFSRDVFSYIAQARVVTAGLDPYRWGVDSVPGWEEIGVDPLWRSTPTPYGPVWLIIQRLTYAASSPLGYHGWLLGFRLIAVLGCIAAVVLAVRIARDRGVAPAIVLWATAASPLVLTTLVVGAHNDAVLVAFMLAGLACALKRRPVAALIFVTLAVGVKPVALVALPVIGLIHIGTDATWRRRIGYWGGSLIACVAALGALGLTIGVGMGWLTSLSAPATVVSWFAPTAIASAATAGVTSLFGIPFDAVLEVFKVVAVLLAIGTAGYVLATRRSMPPLTRLVIAFSVLLALSPVAYGWYLAWPIFVAAAAGLTCSLRARNTLALATIFFVGKDVLTPFNYSAGAIGLGPVLTLNVLSFVVMIAVFAVWYSRNRADSPLSYVADMRRMLTPAVTRRPRATAQPEQ